MGTLPADSPTLVATASVGQHRASTVLSYRLKFEKLVTAIEIAADFVTVVSCLVLSDFLYEFFQWGKRVHYDHREVLVAVAAFAVLFVFLMDRDGAYDSANSLLRIRETERVLRVSIIAFGVFFLISVLVAHLVARTMVLCDLLMVPIALAIQKQIVNQFILHLHSRGYGIQDVVIFGAGDTGKRLFSALTRSPKLGLRPVAIVDDNQELAGKQINESGYRHQHSLAVSRGPVNRHLLHALGARLVLVGIPSISVERLNDIAEEAFAAGSAIAFVPQLSHNREAIMPGYADLDGLLVASLVPPQEKPWYELAKRFFDVFVASLLILMTAPVWVVVAILVKLDSPGPIFFHQNRVGRKGVFFTLYKFRSMRVDAPKYGFHPKSAHDSRITRMGKWLRRTSLDELPQLLNVIRGEMSLVGPRPEMPFIVEGYDNRQRQRLEVTPGITGLWQISADRASLIHENLQYDLYYIRHRNFFMDLALLLHTAMFAMRGT